MDEEKIAKRPKPKRNPSSSTQARGGPIELLKELMAIDSPTRDARGVQRVQMAMERELTSLGFDVRLIPNPITESADLLLAERPGSTPKFVTLVGHADTVLSHADGGEFRLRSDRVHATGSGVIDDKGGLVIALGGLRSYLKSSRKPISLRFVCSPNEETGSPGFIDEFRKLAHDSALALGFEPALENGNIVDSRRGNRWYRIEVEGAEAHAGRSKGEHVNAAHELAIKIAQLHKLNALERGVSINVGRLEGGKDAFNITCGSASCKLDARFATFADRDRLHAKISAIVAKSNVRSIDGARTSRASFALSDDCPPFSPAGRSRKWVDAYLLCARKAEGRAISSERAGGAGDVNYMSDPQLATLDGLGALGGSMHTSREFIYLPSLSTRAEALALFLAKAEALLPQDRQRSAKRR